MSVVQWLSSSFLSCLRLVRFQPDKVEGNEGRGEDEREMRQQPRKTKYRKAFKGTVGGGVGCAQINHGRWALRTREGARLTARQLEASRRALRRRLERRGRV